MLLVIENVLNQQWLNHFSSHWASANWAPGHLTAGPTAKKVKQNLQLDDTDELAVSMREAIMQALGQQPEFMSAALPNKIFPPKFNCYQHGGHYGTHVDNAILTLPSGEALRTDLSATLFLNHPEDYEGGELLIETAFGAQQVKLNAGDMVLYPSSSLHQVTPVTAGARLAAFFWIQSLVANEQDRALLYDLDQSIQALHTTPQDEHQQHTVSQLTAVYHNLVRRWTQS